MWYFFPSEGGEVIPWCPEVVLYIIQPAYGAAQWRAALVAIGVDPKLYTLHSVRKAAASAIYNSGLTERHVQQYGAWASAAYKT